MRINFDKKNPPVTELDIALLATQNNQEVYSVSLVQCLFLFSFNPLCHLNSFDIFLLHMPNWLTISKVFEVMFTS